MLSVIAEKLVKVVLVKVNNLTSSRGRVPEVCQRISVQLVPERESESRAES